jgi:RimJ/RimL family protein N-acetyltransferase
VIERDVELVPFGPEHFDQLIAWSPTPEFLLRWAGPRFKFPLDHDQLEALLRDPALLFTVVVAGQVVGHAEIGRIDPEAGHASLMRILIGDSARRGKGLGEAIVRRLIHIGFEELDLDRLYLNVLRDNAPANSLYARLGFEECEPFVPRGPQVRPMVLTRTAWLSGGEPARPD